jgi:hypothetical protein
MSMSVRVQDEGEDYYFESLTCASDMNVLIGGLVVGGHPSRAASTCQKMKTFGEPCHVETGLVRIVHRTIS